MSSLFASYPNNNIFLIELKNNKKNKKKKWIRKRGPLKIYILIDFYCIKIKILFKKKLKILQRNLLLLLFF
jgi:hypothetical protein